MRNTLAYLGLPVAAAETPLVERCFRTVFNVANGWTLLAGIISIFTMDSTNARWKIVRVICLSISLAIYSVAWPVYRLLKKHGAL